jgi:hypothetical protein
MNLGGQEDCNNFDEGGNKNDHGDLIPTPGFSSTSDTMHVTDCLAVEGKSNCQLFYKLLFPSTARQSVTCIVSEVELKPGVGMRS